MQKLNLQFEAIGTLWNITADLEDISAETIERKITHKIQTFDKHYSRFRTDSLVYEMSQRAGTYKMPPDFFSLITIYDKLYQQTGGLFTPLIGNLLDASGYDRNYSFKLKKIKPVEEWNDVISYTKSTLTIKKPTILDFGGIGKGYLIDEISHMLKPHSNLFIIDAGGDLYTHNTENKSIRIGLEHPENPSQVIGVCEIQNKSICASSGNRRKWSTFHHIMNPKTLSSPSEVLATWVIADTATVADALATSLFLVSPEVFSNDFAFDYVTLNADYTFQISKNFPGELFTTT